MKKPNINEDVFQNIALTGIALFQLTVFVLILIFVSCGKDNSGSNNPATPDSSSNKNKDPGVSTSYYVDNEADLVPCDGSRKGYLAYVKSSSEFKACLDAGWTTVDVKGKDGKDGSSGTNGVNGTNGTNGTPSSLTQWYDPITKKMWMMSTWLSSTVGWNNSMTTCTQDYRMPSPSETVAALMHGMKAAAQGLPGIIPVYIIADDGNSYTVSTGALTASGSGAQFCIAK